MRSSDKVVPDGDAHFKPSVSWAGWIKVTAARWSLFSKLPSGLPIAHSTDVDGTIDDPFHHRHFHFLASLSSRSITSTERASAGSSVRTSRLSITESRLNSFRNMEDLVDEEERQSQRASKAPPSLSDGPVGTKGWQGSDYDLLVDGVHESREAVRKRRQLRLLPEINNLVAQLWSIGVKRGVRMTLKEYMDYHLSCYFFVTSIEEDCDVADLSFDSPCINLYDAWENALLDWRADTEEMQKMYGSRTLHFDSFRDSVFELVDMYTTTTDETQYIGYMRKLVQQISASAKPGSRKPTSWRNPWTEAKVGPLAMAMRKALNGCADEKLSEHFEHWLAAQKAARRQAIFAEAAQAGDATPSDEELEAFLWDELMPCGLDSAYAALAADDPTLPQPPYSQVAITGLLRVLDVDASGGASAKDLQQSVLHKARSGWLTKSGRFRGAVAASRLTKSSSRSKPLASSRNSMRNRRSQTTGPEKR